ncbi:MAG: leucine-rich repeat domain-containing protein, partial [Ruminococcus sp.]|nr:leucine-rich repeat domain-containing protein [Candidatus Apopatosoma intestinale]
IIIDELDAEWTGSPVFGVGEPLAPARFAVFGWRNGNRVELPLSHVVTEYAFDEEGERDVWLAAGGRTAYLAATVCGTYIPELDETGKAPDGTVYRLGKDGMILTDGADATGGVTVSRTVRKDGTEYPVVAIGEYAFKENTSVTTVSCPFVRSVGNGAFFGCSSLLSVHLPDADCTVGDHVFAYCSSLIRVDFPAGTSELGAGLFCDCFRLSSFSIPETVKSIGDQAFLRCSSLRAVTMPEGIESVGSGAFKGCSSLASYILLGAHTAYIGEEAFSGCRSLPILIAPGSIQRIGEKALDGADSLTVYCSSGSMMTACIKSGVPYVKWTADGLHAIGLKTEYTIGEEIQPEDCLAIRYEKSVIRRETVSAFSCLTGIAGPRAVTVKVGEETAAYPVTVSYVEPFSGETDSRGARYVLDEKAKTAKLVSLPDTLLPGSVYAFPDGVYVLPTALSFLGEEYTVDTVASGVFYERKDIRALFLHDRVWEIEAGAIDACPLLTLFYLPVPAGQGLLIDNENLREHAPDLLAVCPLRTSIAQIFCQTHGLSFVSTDEEPDYANYFYAEVTP